MYRLWIIFAQAATVAVAIVFVVATFHPEWLPSRAGAPLPGVPLVQQAPTAGPLPSAAAPGSYHEAVRRATPSVVNIFTSKEVQTPRHPLLNDPVFRRFFGDQLPDETQRASSLGSGVIVSPGGYILTNHHVVEAADEIEVALADGKKLLAKVVGNDPETDLAVLRVDAGNLPAITFGSSDALRVGDVVLAIGNPFGVGQTVTSGIVSALGRTGLGINTFENFIQTDAAINPGNSGGALIDAGGNLIGINTAIFSRSGGSMGIGFAIPVSTAKMVLEQIVKSGSVTRGWIGVEVQELSPQAAESFKLGDTRGALIAGVLRGGPADKAGVKPGDVLYEVEGKPVVDPSTMLNVVAALAPGTNAHMKLKRKGQNVETDVAVGRRPKPQPRPAD
jgi:Do/DeqQ family serine protease